MIHSALAMQVIERENQLIRNHPHRQKIRPPSQLPQTEQRGSQNVENKVGVLVAPRIFELEHLRGVS